jgi:CRP-like cAMP-binding protein
MYFLAKGDAVVEMKDKFGKDHMIGKFGAGSHFGEISLIYNTKRTATVIS